ncbi:6-phosphogluconolactonase [Flavipsychrobacter stenotrophus]|uniref:6-phosphogluconolactonase n=1 Tax=Flavipsychrobacter stenotrophus TaxID=2077091 RepID=A0A2S7SXL2_9BACT|nr:6-phosphogluconolactonase [Flavipsychrobacter stenotrophus]
MYTHHFLVSKGYDLWFHGNIIIDSNESIKELRILKKIIGTSSTANGTIAIFEANPPFKLKLSVRILHNRLWLKRIIFSFTLLCISCSIKAQEYVFAGSYNWDKDKPGIYVFKLDTVTGTLKHISTVDSVLNPGYLTVSANGKYVYACTEAHTAGMGSVSSYVFDKVTGKLTFVNKQSSNGENPVYVTTDRSNHWLINANYTEGSVSVYHLLADGSIAPASQIIAFDGSSINKERQDAAHIHAAVLSPLEDHVFLPDLGSDVIRHYKFNNQSARPLTEAQPSSLPTMPGSGPRHFTFHPDGKYCYCIEELAGYVSAYRYMDGSFTCIQRVASHKHNAAKEHSSADIHVSPDGRFLYASNRGDENNIAIYKIEEKTGLVKLIGHQSTTGDHPRIFALSPSGKYLIVANQISGDIVVFRRNIKTGMLSKTGKEKVEGASCIHIVYY